MKDIKIERFPVILNPNTCLVINVFKAEHHLNDLWIEEYWNTISTVETAAKQLVSQIRDNSSVRFVQALRKELGNLIEEWNEERGTNHPLDK